MSTTSTATVSVAHDHTLGDDPDFCNCICVLTVVGGDGNPFNGDSLLEEDIIKLCVGMGQVHPNGVLQLMAMGLVIAVCFSEEMLATAHLIASATVWCDDPIRLHKRTPTDAQIHNYTTMRHRHPSGAPAPTPQFDSTTFMQ